MRISESYVSFTLRSLRAVAPAPAREVFRANTESLTTDTVSTTGIGGGAEREARVAELKQLYQEGKYQVDPEQVSASIIDEHLAQSSTD